MDHSSSKQTAVLSIPVMVAALGYFVDIYDLVLFSIVRKPSLTALGLSGGALENQGLFLLNVQMVGMLFGGLFWGILGDKKGRLSVLFGSILMYSLANIANAYVVNITQYGILRFVAGFGLAGELGAGITLVSEILKKEHRGWGTTLVATVGVSGAILAGFLGLNFNWTTCYLVGGILGLALLLLRVGVFESGMYEQTKAAGHQLGSLRLLFSSKRRIVLYLKCILVGLPIWYTIGILITLSPELGKEMGVVGDIKPALAIMFCYAGVTLGDLASGVISQLMQSRKKVLAYFVAATLLMVLVYFQMKQVQVATLYGVMMVLGFAAGYWAVLMTTSSELFGTNVRATVTTSVPNFIRASLVPISLLYAGLEKTGMLKTQSALITGIICCSIALWAAIKLPESFHHELDFHEEH
jgi:putative MFS transporter